MNSIYCYRIKYNSLNILLMLQFYLCRVVIHLKDFHGGELLIKRTVTVENALVI